LLRAEQFAVLEHSLYGPRLHLSMAHIEFANPYVLRQDVHELLKALAASCLDA
jgi:hypothetical protein